MFCGGVHFVGNKAKNDYQKDSNNFRANIFVKMRTKFDYIVRYDQKQFSTFIYRILKIFGKFTRKNL